MDVERSRTAASAPASGIVFDHCCSSRHGFSQGVTRLVAPSFTMKQSRLLVDQPWRWEAAFGAIITVPGVLGA
jgi:hypothetical protein